MILTCPSCGTQYVVKDGAIPPEGRQVRCAACKHSWHQDPEAGSEPAVTEEPQPTPEAEPLADEAPASDREAIDEDESFAEAALIEPRSGPEAEERAYQEAAIEGEIGPSSFEAPAEAGQPQAAAEEAQTGTEDWGEPPEAEPAADMFTPFVGEDSEAPRRGGAVTKLLVAAVVIILLAVAFWFVAPANLKAKLGLAAVDTTPLKIVTTHMDRRPLESGNSLLTLTGRVINPSASEQPVPALQAELSARNGKVLKSWTIPAPVSSLAPGASAGFNSAEVNVPPGGEYLTITAGQKA